LGNNYLSSLLENPTKKKPKKKKKKKGKHCLPRHWPLLLHDFTMDSRNALIGCFSLDYALSRLVDVHLTGQAATLLLK
jgi:hypothetical protein